MRLFIKPSPTHTYTYLRLLGTAMASYQLTSPIMECVLASLWDITDHLLSITYSGDHNVTLYI